MPESLDGWKRTHHCNELRVENIGTEWCDNDDIKRILTESMRILEGARQESRDSDGKYDEWIENA